jgi:hypothetical protein
MLGSIYRLECKETSKFYIGSTTLPLNKRLIKHKTSSNEERRMKSPLYSHFREVGWDKAEIMLIKEVEYKDRRDLLSIEKAEILINKNNDKCLNHNRPIITREEKMERDKDYAKNRRSENKESEKERLQKWRLANPDKRKEQTKRERERKKLSI